MHWLGSNIPHAFLYSQQAFVAPVQTIMSLMNLRPTVIRGNASEIMAIAGATGNTKGVDSTAESTDALEHAKRLAKEFGCIVAVSGATDLV